MTPADIIKKVRRLEIRARHLVTDSVSGAYHSSFKGRGMDFEEVREYEIGDDVRTIDWNVSAKMDRPFVKVFREEREMTLMLLIDLSASGIFGSVEQSKRERAAEIASVLAFTATQNNDKVGVLLYTDEVEHYIPPKKGRRHILRLIRDILILRAQRPGHFAPGRTRLSQSCATPQNSRIPNFRLSRRIASHWHLRHPRAQQSTPRLDQHCTQRPSRMRASTSRLDHP